MVWKLCAHCLHFHICMYLMGRFRSRFSWCLQWDDQSGGDRKWKWLWVCLRPDYIQSEGAAGDMWMLKCSTEPFAPISVNIHSTAALCSLWTLRRPHQHQTRCWCGTTPLCGTSGCSHPPPPHPRSDHFLATSHSAKETVARTQPWVADFAEHKQVTLSSAWDSVVSSIVWRLLHPPPSGKRVWLRINMNEPVCWLLKHAFVKGPNLWKNWIAVYFLLRNDSFCLCAKCQYLFKCSISSQSLWSILIFGHIPLSELSEALKAHGLFALSSL